jgi:hypothetical protein
MQGIGVNLRGRDQRRRRHRLGGGIEKLQMVVNLLSGLSII